MAERYVYKQSAELGDISKFLQADSFMEVVAGEHPDVRKTEEVIENIHEKLASPLTPEARTRLQERIVSLRTFAALEILSVVYPDLPVVDVQKGSITGPENKSLITLDSLPSRFLIEVDQKTLTIHGFERGREASFVRDLLKERADMGVWLAGLGGSQEEVAHILTRHDRATQFVLEEIGYRRVLGIGDISSTLPQALVLSRVIDTFSMSELQGLNGNKHPQYLKFISNSIGSLVVNGLHPINYQHDLGAPA